jgi:Domain of unknown function (DUF4124)
MSVRLSPGVLGMLMAFVGWVPVALAANNPSAGKETVYRWTDDQGVVHYGDSIPPQYSQRERAVLNSRGVEVRKLDAQKTPDQLAAEERTQQNVIKQKQHDAFLMNTYTSVKDIEALRDLRLDQLHGQRVAAEQYVDSLHGRMSSLQQRALKFKPYNDRPGAHRMPDDVAEDLVRTLNELRVQDNALSAKTEEEALVNTQFQTDIERYRELRAKAVN